jgi:hypothetical protein
MTNRQIAESNMIEIVELYFNDNETVLDELKMIKVGATKLSNKKKSIDDLAKLQVGSTKGVTAVKNITLFEIKISGETHRSNLCNLAKEIGKDEILADFKMTPTAFKYGGEEKVLTKCTNLLKAARTVENETSASIYLVAKEDNDAFEVLLNSYQPKKKNQTTKKNTQKKITLDIKQAFTHVHEILKQLDSDVRNNATKKYPDFVEGYFIARKINNHKRGGGTQSKTPPAEN